MIAPCTRAERYAQVALERQCAELASIGAERNSHLNRAAFALGQLVGAGYLDRAEAEADLLAAAHTNGYTAKDGMAAARATIRSGISRGILHPREIPEGRLGGTAQFRPDPDELSRQREIRRSAEEAERADTARRQQLALAIWESGRDPHGTAVQRYLQGRGLDLPEGIAGRVIRLVERGVWEGGTALLMVALMRDALTGEPRAVHRTALTQDGRKLGRKMLGPSAGTAIMLSPATDTLVAAEGIETTLAAHQHFGLSPVWALGSSGAMAKLPVIDAVKRLVVIAENDANGASASAVETVGERWHAAGRAVEVVWPSLGFKDLNDMVMGGRRA